MNVWSLAFSSSVDWRFWLWATLSFAGLFLASFTLSLTLVGLTLVRLPATYFLDSPERGLWIHHRRSIRWLGLVLKNMVGCVLVMLGIVLSLPGVPGQGLLTILLGILLLDLPGKRRLARRILAAPHVLDRVNQLRAQFGKPPLLLEEPAKQTVSNAS